MPLKKVDLPTAIFVGVLLVGAVLMGWQEALHQDILPTHTEAPHFSLERLSGAPLDLPSLRGQVVVVNFWATWCPPCREEIPYLVSTIQEYEKQGVTLVAVNNDDVMDQRQAIDGFLVRFPQLRPYVVLGQPEVGERYQVRALPSLFVIDREGKISASFQGQASEGQLRRWVEAALAE